MVSPTSVKHAFLVQSPCLLEVEVSKPRFPHDTAFGEECCGVSTALNIYSAFRGAYKLAVVTPNIAADEWVINRS